LDAHHPSKLKLFEAHLLQRDSFLTAMKGCSAVFHVASPFLVPEKIRDPKKQLFRPAVEGTQNILESGSLYTIDQLLSGHMLLGVPNLAFALVDVREVALRLNTAHLAAVLYIAQQ
jgi:UDP-glucose 4-epimerase